MRQNKRFRIGMLSCWLGCQLMGCSAAITVDGNTAEPNGREFMTALVTHMLLVFSSSVAPPTECVEILTGTAGLKVCEFEGNPTDPLGDVPFPCPAAPGGVLYMEPGVLPLIAADPILPAALVARCQLGPLANTEDDQTTDPIGELIRRTQGAVADALLETQKTEGCEPIRKLRETLNEYPELGPLILQFEQDGDRFSPVFVCFDTEQTVTIPPIAAFVPVRNEGIVLQVIVVSPTTPEGGWTVECRDGPFGGTDGPLKIWKPENLKAAQLHVTPLDDSIEWLTEPSHCRVVGGVEDSNSHFDVRSHSAIKVLIENAWGSTRPGTASRPLH